MKKLIILSLMLFVSIHVFSQEGGTAYTTFTLATAKTYADAQTDTLPSPSGAIVVKLGTLSMVSLETTYIDSIDVEIFIDTRVKGSTTWTVKDSVTIVATGSGVAEWLLRGTAVDKIAGVTNDNRFRYVFSGSANSANSGATYTPRLRYRY